MLLCEIEYNWDQKSAVIGWFFLFEWKKKPLWIITIALQQHCEWTHSQHMLVVCLHVHPRASLLFLLCIFIIIIRRHWAFDDEDSADASIFTSRQRHRCANINANVNVNDEDWVDWMMRIGAMRRYLHRGRGTAHPAPPFYHIIHLISLLITIIIIIRVLRKQGGQLFWSDRDYDAPLLFILFLIIWDSETKSWIKRNVIFWSN